MLLKNIRIVKIRRSWEGHVWAMTTLHLDFFIYTYYIKCGLFNESMYLVLSLGTLKLKSWLRHWVNIKKSVRGGFKQLNWKKGAKVDFHKNTKLCYSCFDNKLKILCWHFPESLWNCKSIFPIALTAGQDLS